MKNTLIICLLFVVSNVFGQDYLVKPDGTKLVGRVVWMAKKTLSFETQEGQTAEYKINGLAVIHIADPDFKMKEVYLTNTKYDRTDRGIHLEMLDNPIDDRESNTNTTNINLNAEHKSSLSITTDDHSPKAKIVLECTDCTNTGTLMMESEDKLSKLLWSFEATKGRAFPMEVELNSGKVYSLYYRDGNRHAIEKKVSIKPGLNRIGVFE